MINLPLNFSAPTEQVQNTYAQPARTNQYLTPSQYEGMQLHTPSGYYYQGDKFYEPYTVGTKQASNYNNPLIGGNSPFPSSSNSSFYGNPFYGIGGMGMFNSVPDVKEGSVQVGNQYFKPFAGNAQGIINGNLSMASMLNQQPTYQPQGIPSNLLNFLSSPNIQPTNNQQSSGAGRFLGLLGSPQTTNT
jgi:hypothetical protein